MVCELYLIFLNEKKNQKWPYVKGNITRPSGFISEMQGLFDAWKPINVIHYTDSLKKKTHMITSIDTSDSIINPFLI